MTDLRFVYMTAASEGEAKKIAHALVERRLAACVNMLGGMTSIFRWKGAVQEEREVAMIAKTRADLVPALTEAAKELHSYEVPCIVSIPLAPSEGNEDFLDWIEAME